MITVNTDGNLISAEFIEAIRSDSPSTLARLWYNGSALDCAIENITIEKGSCGSNPFMIGEVVGDLLTATVRGLLDDIKGQVIECHIGYLTGDSYEFISLGQFKVSTVKKTRYQSEITAYSAIVANSGNDFDTQNISSPTLAELAIRLQSDLNCTISFDADIDTTVTLEALLTDLTDYQVLQMLATCCGGYAINTIDGNIVIKRYNATPTLDVDTGMMVNLPEIAEKEYRIRQIGVVVSEATEDADGNEVDAVYYTLDSQAYLIAIKQGSEYYIVDEDGNRIISNIRPETADIYFECPYMTEEIFTANIATLVGYAYYPANIDLTLGDPRLEGSDVLAVTEINGSVYTVPCHMLTQTYSGGFTTNVRSADASDEEDDIGTEYPVTRRLQSMSRQTSKAQETANQAYQIAGTTNQYFWFRGQGTDTGAHITEIPQEQWDDPNSPYYQSGGNLLARSNGIAVRSGLTELATFGANGVTLGVEGEAYLKMDAQSMKLVDRNENPYFQISNLKETQDREITEQHIGWNLQLLIDGVTYYAIGLNEYAESVVSVTVNGVPKSTPADYILYNDKIYGLSYICLVANPTSTGVTVVDYYIDTESLKAYTIGTRVSGSDTGLFSFAEGYEVIAEGRYSHAQNIGTDAIGFAQTVIGRYNTTNYGALIIGNGNSDSERSNAFTVDWSGNVEMALNTSASSGSTDYALYQAITALGWASDVIE